MMISVFLLFSFIKKSHEITPITYLLHFCAGSPKIFYQTVFVVPQIRLHCKQTLNPRTYRINKPVPSDFFGDWWNRLAFNGGCHKLRQIRQIPFQRSLYPLEFQNHNILQYSYLFEVLYHPQQSYRQYCCNF